MNSVVVARKAEAAVSVIWSDGSFSALEVQPLVEARPWCGEVGWSWLAMLMKLLDTAVLCVHHVVVLRWRHGGRAAAVRSALFASVLHRRVVTRWASPSGRHAGVAGAPIQPGSR